VARLIKPSQPTLSGDTPEAFASSFSFRNKSYFRFYFHQVCPFFGHNLLTQIIDEGWAGTSCSGFLPLTSSLRMHFATTGERHTMGKIKGVLDIRVTCTICICAMKKASGAGKGVIWVILLFGLI